MSKTWKGSGGRSWEPKDKRREGRGKGWRNDGLKDKKRRYRDRKG